MARGKIKQLENLKGNKYIFDVNDHLLAGDWSFIRPGRAFFDDDYLEIVEFFCLHSPCRQGSYSPRTLESIGWKNQWHSDKFRNRIREIAGFDDSNFISVEYHHQFKQLWETTGLPDDFTSIRSSFAYFAAAGESNPYMNLFHRIRNSFAHGRYKVIRDRGEYYIYFEDVKTAHGCTYVLARICLTKTILDRWCKFLNMSNDAAEGFENIKEGHSK